MTAMQHSMDSNTAAVKEVERKVEKLDSALQEKEEDLEKIVKKTEFNIYDEMRERETRRLIGKMQREGRTRSSMLRRRTE